jgi:hypothetical protein
MRCRLNGTYDITYDDGDKEQGVKAELVRAKGGEGSSGGGKGASSSGKGKGGGSRQSGGFKGSPELTRPPRAGTPSTSRFGGKGKEMGRPGSPVGKGRQSGMPSGKGRMGAARPVFRINGGSSGSSSRQSMAERLAARGDSPPAGTGSSSRQSMAERLAARGDSPPAGTAPAGRVRGVGSPSGKGCRPSIKSRLAVRGGSPPF